MFFAEDRIPMMQEMILARTEFDRRAALKKLLPLQKSDFIGLFEIMHDKPVTIRTLDPPLHEFLPKREDLMTEIAVLKAKNAPAAQIEPKQKLLERVEELHEFNPMMGHRGCRLGITYPEITEMQAQAIFEAACELVKKGKNVLPEVMIPIVGFMSEFRNQKAIVESVAERVIAQYGVKLSYTVGSMIEVPRACVVADDIAKEAQFFSFGTNDLTQLTCGFSRDDALKFITAYVERGLFDKDPFVSIDETGVGQMVRMAVEKGRTTNPKLKIGICGEHGGDPASIDFCHRAGLDYVSCSPFRLPIARLAAARSTIVHGAQPRKLAAAKAARESAKPARSQQKPKAKPSPSRYQGRDANP
jgi:pyruvate,orthophosphate dikinase